LLNPRDQAVELQATVMETNLQGHRRLQFSGAHDLLDQLETLGEVPLPPYIRRADKRSLETDRRRYQTVYARPPGSVAAPTAGLHFTEELLSQLRLSGIEVCSLTLHVGLGTFAPVKAETLAAHPMHAEAYNLSEQTAHTINQARRQGRRVFAAGTTTLRVLESVADAHTGQVVAARGRTRIFIYPPYQFKIVDGLLTNFHLPRSTLLMLVSAFATPGQTRGRELVLDAYADAVRQGYRFFSYGDAMLVV
jgi:S-adenosylmethionine:tRNA ribosyltransferase-isomerase